MTLYLGGKKLNSLYYGGKKLTALFFGGKKIWQYYAPSGSVLYSQADTGWRDYYESEKSAITLSVDASKIKNGITIEFYPGTWVSSIYEYGSADGSVMYQKTGGNSKTDGSYGTFFSLPTTKFNVPVANLIAGNASANVALNFTSSYVGQFVYKPLYVMLNGNQITFGTGSSPHTLGTLYGRVSENDNVDFDDTSQTWTNFKYNETTGSLIVKSITAY